MRILLWAPYGAGSHYWGPGMSAFRLYKNQLGSDVQLFLAHGYDKQEIYSDVFTNQYYISNLSGNNLKAIRLLVFLIKSFFFIKKRCNEFDVVHCLSSYESSFRPALWMERRGLPVACKITGASSTFESGGKISKLLGLGERRKKTINDISAYISISEEITRMLIKEGALPDKIHAIPNGVDIDRFCQPESEEKIALRKKYGVNNVFTILFVGGISARKQPMMLAEMLNNCVQLQGMNIQVVMVGPDRSKNNEIGKIKKYVSDNNLDDHFFYFDHTNVPEDFYKLSDVFCLPSLQEGMSNALLEAMSSGLPCLVTPISGSTDLVDDGVNGKFITNLEELVNQISKLNSNHELLIRYGEHARHKIEAGFSRESVYKRHIELFCNIRGE